MVFRLLNGSAWNISNCLCGYLTDIWLSGYSNPSFHFSQDKSTIHCLLSLSGRCPEFSRLSSVSVVGMPWQSPTLQTWHADSPISTCEPLRLRPFLLSRTCLLWLSDALLFPLEALLYTVPSPHSQNHAHLSKTHSKCYVFFPQAFFYPLNGIQYLFPLISHNI